MDRREIFGQQANSNQAEKISAAWIVAPELGGTLKVLRESALKRPQILIRAIESPSAPNLCHDFPLGILSRRSITPGGGTFHIKGTLQISLHVRVAFNQVGQTSDGHFGHLGIRCTCNAHTTPLQKPTQRDLTGGGTPLFWLMGPTVPSYILFCTSG